MVLFSNKEEKIRKKQKLFLQKRNTGRINPETSELFIHKVRNSVEGVRKGVRLL